MSTEVVITKYFVEDAMAKANIDVDLLDVDQARYLLYCDTHQNECIEEGSIMVNTCKDDTCVNPSHVKIIPPKKQH